MRVTPLRPEHVAEIAAWFSDAETARRIDRPPASGQRSGQSWFAAHVGADLVGLAVIEPDPDEPDSAWILVAISPERRRRGHGRRVLEAMAETARAAGFSHLLAEIACDNLASLAAARSSGFEVRDGDPVPTRGFVRVAKALK